MVQTGQRRVLVIEDDEALARSYERTIRKLGWSCVCVFSAEEALHYLHAWKDAPCSAVLLDHALPDGRGLSLVPRLEASVAVEAAALHVPVVPKPINAELLAQLLSAEPVALSEFEHLFSSLTLSDDERILLTKLAERSPAWVDTKDLALALGRRDDSGSSLIWQHIRQLRKKLRRHGLRIESRRRRGGYRLVRTRRRGVALAWTRRNEEKPL